MLTHELHAAADARRVTSLLAAELDQAAQRREFGVIVRDVAPLDLEDLTDALAKPRAARAPRLRVALVGEGAVVDEALARHAALRGILAAEEETAVRWRNERLRTIAVVTNRPLAKSASLRDFRPIGEHDLARRLCREEREKAEVAWLRGLWSVLERAHTDAGVGGPPLRIPLADLVRFAIVLGELPISDRSAQAPGHLHLLGLFPDARLADERSENRLLRRLMQNRGLVQEVRRATEEDWARVRAYQQTLTSTARTIAGRMARRLRDTAKGGHLEGLDLDTVQTLWRGKVSTVSTELNEGGPGRKTDRIQVERAVGRMLMAEDYSRLGDIAEEVRQVVQAALDDDVRSASEDIRQASSVDTAAYVQVDREILVLVRSRSTERDWGGVIEVASERPAALTEVTAFRSWSPFTIEPLEKDLANFVEGGIAPEALMSGLSRFATLRRQLVPHVCELAVSPVAALAGNSGLLETTEQYLSAYEQLLGQLRSIYSDMHAAADFEAESIVGRLLCLELYVYRRDGQTEAVMSPLHPLYLWRGMTIVREVRALGRVLSDHEVATLEEACADDLQFLQVLVLPRLATGQDQPLMLGQAGSLGRLPVFREAPRGVMEADGVRTVAELADRLATLRPFARPGLRVMLVNLPRPARFVEELVGRLGADDGLEEGGFSGLHVRVRYTQADTRGWAAEVRDLDETVRERLTTAEERGLLSLSVQGEAITWDKLRREIQEHPAHLLAIFDPFEVRSTPVSRAQAHTLSPWMPSREYRFNKIRKEIQIIPVAEEHVFGTYLAAAALVHTALQRKTPAHLPQVRDIKETLDVLAAAAVWTVVADPHRVSLARLGNAEVIDRRIERGRQLTCFAHDLSPFVRRLDQQLRKTHFLAERETLERLVRDLVMMEPNGILSLAGSSHEKQVKGSLGKLIAVRWYRSKEPSGLAVSLDTATAQRWLVAGLHSRQKADLLGLREEAGALVIDAIEVKAHDEAAPYSVQDGIISGTAVGQVLSTLQALAEVFTPDGASPLAKPRREVLREHLYTALLRDQEPGYVERWHSLIEDAFAGRLAVRLGGRIVHVQLASVAAQDSRTYLTRQGVPIRVDTLSAQDVGLVLRPSRPIREESTLTAAAPGIGEVVEAEPSQLLQQLVTPIPAQDDGNPNRGEQGSFGSTAEPIAPRAEVTSVGSDLGGSPPDSAAAVAKPANQLSSLEVILGVEQGSSTPAVWQPGRQSNGFFLILGASGSGKTETLKVLGSAIAESGIPVLVFDFHGDVVLPNVQSVLLSSGSASIFGLNSMELDVQSAEESGLYDQRASLRGMIQRAVPALGHRQASILRDAFDEAYRRAGIVDSDPSTWNRRAPTFGTIQEILEEWTDADERKAQRSAIEGCLAAVQELFGHPIFAREQQISIDQMLTESVRLDLSKLPDQIRFIATETLLRRLFRTLRLRGPIPVQPADDRQRFRLFIVIDEAKILSLGSGDRDRADNILNELITEARKFGLGMIIASQMSEHFSEEVRANAATWLVLKPMDIREAKKNAPNVGVDPEDLTRLRGRGDGYYRDRAGGRSRRIQVTPRASGQSGPD
ncbi:MAG: helicase HerA-like domain-containing protein [Geminicoccaceae bacterium]